MSPLVYGQRGELRPELWALQHPDLCEGSRARKGNRDFRRAPQIVFREGGCGQPSGCRGAAVAGDLSGRSRVCGLVARKARLDRAEERKAGKKLEMMGTSPGCDWGRRRGFTIVVVFTRWNDPILREKLMM